MSPSASTSRKRPPKSPKMEPRRGKSLQKKKSGILEGVFSFVSQEIHNFVVSATGQEVDEQSSEEDYGSELSDEEEDAPRTPTKNNRKHVLTPSPLVLRKRARSSSSVDTNTRTAPAPPSQSAPKPILQKKPSGTIMPGSLYPLSPFHEPDDDERRVHFRADTPPFSPHTEDAVPGPSNPPRTPKSQQSQASGSGSHLQRTPSSVQAAVAKFRVGEDPSLLLPRKTDSPTRIISSPAGPPSSPLSAKAKGKTPVRTLALSDVQDDLSATSRDIQAQITEHDAEIQRTREGPTDEGDKSRIQALEAEIAMLKEELARRPAAGMGPPPPPPPPPPIMGTIFRVPTEEEDPGPTFANVRAALRHAPTPKEKPINPLGGRKAVGAPAVGLAPEKMAAFLNEMKTVRLRKVDKGERSFLSEGDLSRRDHSFDTSINWGAGNHTIGAIAVSKDKGKAKEAVRQERSFAVGEKRKRGDSVSDMDGEGDQSVLSRVLKKRSVMHNASASTSRLPERADTLSIDTTVSASSSRLGLPAARPQSTSNLPQHRPPSPKPKPYTDNPPESKITATKPQTTTLNAAETRVSPHQQEPASPPHGGDTSVVLQRENGVIRNWGARPHSRRSSSHPGDTSIVTQRENGIIRAWTVSTAEATAPTPSLCSDHDGESGSSRTSHEEDRVPHTPPHVDRAFDFSSVVQEETRENQEAEQLDEEYGDHEGKRGGVYHAQATPQFLKDIDTPRWEREASITYEVELRDPDQEDEDAAAAEDDIHGAEEGHHDDTHHEALSSEPDRPSTPAERRKSILFQKRMPSSPLPEPSPRRPLPPHARRTSNPRVMRSSPPPPPPSQDTDDETEREGEVETHAPSSPSATQPKAKTTKRLSNGTSHPAAGRRRSNEGSDRSLGTAAAPASPKVHANVGSQRTADRNVNGAVHTNGYAAKSKIPKPKFTSTNDSTTASVSAGPSTSRRRVGAASISMSMSATPGFVPNRSPNRSRTLSISASTGTSSRTLASASSKATNNRQAKNQPQSASVPSTTFSFAALLIPSEPTSISALLAKPPTTFSLDPTKPFNNVSAPTRPLNISKNKGNVRAPATSTISSVPPPPRDTELATPKAPTPRRETPPPPPRIEIDEPTPRAPTPSARPRSRSSRGKFDRSPTRRQTLDEEIRIASASSSSVSGDSPPMNNGRLMPMSMNDGDYSMSISGRPSLMPDALMKARPSLMNGGPLLMDEGFDDELRDMSDSATGFSELDPMYSGEYDDGDTLRGRELGHEDEMDLEGDVYAGMGSMEPQGFMAHGGAGGAPVFMPYT